MRPIAYQSPAATSRARVETDIPARPSRANRTPHASRFSRRGKLLLIISTVLSLATIAAAETRPHYGGPVRLMMQSAPITLDLPANATPADYWDTARTLSLIGDTLVTLDPQGRPQPALAQEWQSDPARAAGNFSCAVE